jgi:hypothetical protein
MDLLKSARDEIQSLEKTVSDALARLTDLRAFVEAGERLYGQPFVRKSILHTAESWPLPQATDGGAKPSEAAAPEKHKRAPSAIQGKAGQIVARVEWALGLAESGHMQSKELVGVLQDHGIELGADPIGSLSAYLSKSGRFLSERAKGGWALKQPTHKEEPPPDVGASAGA